MTRSACRALLVLPVLSFLAALALPASFASAQAPTSATDPQLHGRRHMNLTVGLPIVIDSRDDYDNGIGAEVTFRIGYEIDILVIEGHAGFQSFQQDASAPGNPSRRVTGPFLGFGARLRFPVSEVFVPYVMGGLRLSWWKVTGASVKFAPTMVSQLGGEIHFGAGAGDAEWMLHVGIESHVYMPGKALANRAWSLGPYGGVGIQF